MTSDNANNDPADSATERSLDKPRRFFEFYESEPDDSKTLLGDRWLCRGKAGLFIGPTGVGKSSASIQQDALWSMGRTAFGIMPAKPLKILTVQAENDDEDTTDVISSIRDSLVGEDWAAKDIGISTDAEWNLLNDNYIHFTKSNIRGEAFLQWLADHIAEHAPDLVRIDPLFSFIDFDPQDTEKLRKFLREGISPMLEFYDCGANINHHTPKTGRETGKLSNLDFAYAGAGAAELANWARAILVVDQTGDPHTFNFIAAKRGGRIGWKDRDGKPQERRMFMQDKEGRTLWHDADESAKKSAKTKRGKVDAGKVFEGLVPQTGALEKTDLLLKMNASGVPKDEARNYVKRMIDDKPPVFHEWKEKRARLRDRVSVSRQPQPAPESSAPDSPPDDGGKREVKQRNARS